MLIIQRRNKGFSVIEILISVSLIVIAFITFLSIISLSLKSTRFAENVNKADFLARELIEAARSFRQGTGWDSNGLGVLDTDTDYYFSLTGSNPPDWVINPGQENIGIFTRSIVFEKVSRDPITKEIQQTYNVSNDDPDTRKVIVRVFFDSKIIELTTYLTNWQ